MHGKPFPRWVSIAILLTIATIFGSNHIAARIAFDHGVNVTTAIVARSLAAVLFVGVLVIAGRVPLALTAATRWRAVAVGVLISVQSYCLYSAVARIPVALALLAFNTYPMMFSLISWATGSERPARRALIAMPVALFGLALALDVSGVSGGIAARWDAIGVGVGFALGAAVSFSAALHLTARWLHDVDGRLRTLLTMSTVALLMLAAGTIAGDLALPSNPGGWLGLGLLMLFYGTAFTTMFVLLPRLDVMNNSAALNFEPIAVLFLAWPILGQSVAPRQIVGALIVVGAVIALGTGRR
ncbi:MAG TPA: DMT family transporter [Burkholderiales bacterium]|nr:DMT family transporter [Burkholderiales bacterium]